MDNFSKTQIITKRVASTARGLVSAQHTKAAKIGADILANGGDCIDAACATSFAMGVLEPWMSGATAGGAAIFYRAAEDKTYCVNFGLKSPISLDKSAFKLNRGTKSKGLFPWTEVEGRCNEISAKAFATPGLVAGMDHIHKKFGKMPWQDLIMPSAHLARDGILVDWYCSLIIASAAKDIAMDKDLAKLFLDDSLYPIIGGWTALDDTRIKLSKMANTLEYLAKAGANDFYHGDIAKSLVSDIEKKGGFLSLKDLKNYKVITNDPIEIPTLNDGIIYAVPDFTAGTSLARVRELINPTLTKELTKYSYENYASAITTAYEERLQTQGDSFGSDTEEKDSRNCTTSFAVLDDKGNICCVTQTLLSIFGSRTMGEETGLLLNNGMFWFDPEPNKPNSIDSNKRCLMNVCPIIGKNKAITFGLGAAGGRKIMPSVAQISSFLLDYDMSLEQAFHTPKIDCSTIHAVITDSKLPNETKKHLIEKFDKVVMTKRNIFPYSFACPSCVLRRDGINQGCSEVMSVWSDTVIS